MSYPPLRSWPISRRDFPPPEPDHWFFRFRKWFWPAAIIGMMVMVVGGAIIAFISTSAWAGFVCFVLMTGLAVLCFALAMIAGFGVALLDFGKLEYEHRVELVTGLSSMLLFFLGVGFGVVNDWFLP